MNRWICRRCRGVTPLEEDRCSVCRAPRAAVAEPLRKRCRLCGREFRGSRHCPLCASADCEILT